MATPTKRLIIVVTTDVRADANTRAKQVDTRGGEYTFMAPLFAAGSTGTVATHYWCSWAMSDRDHNNLQALLDSLKTSGEARVFAASPALAEEGLATPASVLATLGLERIPAAPVVSSGR